MAATTQVRLLVWSFSSYAFPPLVPSRAEVLKSIMCPLTLTEHAFGILCEARLAQSAEHKALNLAVVGASPTVAVLFS